MKRILFLLMVVVCGLLCSSCSDDDVPEAEPEEEIITDVTLTFMSTTGATVIATAQDPDGEGPLNIEIEDEIVLAAETEYTLSIELENAIEGESITEEVQEESDEHMFFFSWTADIFSDPAGDGNIDSRDDPVNYEDFDAEIQPLGLVTTWTTKASGSGSFRVVLKHQPDIKSVTSTAQDGESDIDLTWNIAIQ